MKTKSDYICIIANRNRNHFIHTSMETLGKTVVEKTTGKNGTMTKIHGTVPPKRTSKKVNVVESTTDYSLFKSLSGNRIIDEGTVRRLIQSFEKRYLLSPILVNEKFEIIDGQHRFQAAKELSLPINYIVIPGYSLPEVQILNSNTKNWTKLDYLDSYCELEYPAYLTMQKFMEKFPEFGFRSAETLLTFNYWGVNYNTKLNKDRKQHKATGKVHVRVRKFESGELEIEDYAKSVGFANKILEYREFFEGYHRHVFVNTMVGLLDNPKFSHEEMIEKLRQQPTSLVACVTVQQYRTLIENIYNYKRREKVNLRF